MDNPAAAVWSDPDASAVELVLLGLDRYAADPGEATHCLNWVPQTWRDEVYQDAGVPIHPRNLDRLMAAGVLLTRPHEFYASEAGFVDLVEGLAGEWFDAGVSHPPTTAELARALVEAHLLAPPEPDEKLSPAVVRLIHSVARNDGYPKTPGVFSVFGVPADPTVPDLPLPDGDPDLALAAAGGADDREADFDADLRDWLAELAARIAHLPLRRGAPAAQAVAAELTTLARSA